MPTPEDQSCSNCQYFVLRVHSSKDECHQKSPAHQGGIGFWPEVKPEDWCGEYREVGWNDPSKIITASVVLTTPNKVQIVATPNAEILVIGSINVTNSDNKGQTVRLYDGDTTTLIGVVSAPGGGVGEARYDPALRCFSGSLWADPDQTPAGQVTVYVQGRIGQET